MIQQHRVNVSVLVVECFSGEKGRCSCLVHMQSLVVMMVASQRQLQANRISCTKAA